ncbi:hypothetical protein [Brevibacillus laterosporus]|uniref:hypothetical protein n=1 Tax=Brevibacillus laterosporus TaxID=1465 RepID=UPI003D24AF2A
MEKPFTVYVVFEYEGEEVTSHKAFENESDLVKYASEISSDNNSDSKIIKIFAITESGRSDEMEWIYNGKISLVRKDIKKH